MHQAKVSEQINAGIIEERSLDFASRGSSIQRHQVLTREEIRNIACRQDSLLARVVHLLKAEVPRLIRVRINVSAQPQSTEAGSAAPSWSALVALCKLARNPLSLILLRRSLAVKPPTPILQRTLWNRLAPDYLCRAPSPNHSVALTFNFPDFPADAASVLGVTSHLKVRFHSPHLGRASSSREARSLATSAGLTSLNCSLGDAENRYAAGTQVDCFKQRANEDALAAPCRREPPAVSLGHSLALLCFFASDQNIKAKGCFAPERFAGRTEAKVTAHELALIPDCFTARTDEEILSTLAHEMVHVWQQTHGTPPRRSYHDREWARKMKESAKELPRRISIRSR
jgi:hypothetical protein